MAEPRLRPHSGLLAKRVAGCYAVEGRDHNVPELGGKGASIDAYQ
ncbi:MAG: hypothetical protein QNL85_03780 [Euryarchaeota archaeon]